MRTSAIGRVLQQVGGMMSRGSRRRSTARPAAGTRGVRGRGRARRGAVPGGSGGIGRLVRRFLR